MAETQIPGWETVPASDGWETVPEEEAHAIDYVEQRVKPLMAKYRNYDEMSVDDRAFLRMTAPVISELGLDYDLEGFGFRPGGKTPRKAATASPGVFKDAPRVALDSLPPQVQEVVAGSVPQPRTPEEANQLPAGQVFLRPDGTFARKRTRDDEFEPAESVYPEDWGGFRPATIDDIREGTRNAASLAYARRRLQESAAPNLLATGVGLGASVASPVMRAAGSGVAADESQRLSAALSTAAAERDVERYEAGETIVPPIVARGARGAAQTVPSMIVGGAVAGPYGAISAAGIQELDRSITDAKDAGLEGADLYKYAATQGAIEAGVAAAFQRAGLGGLESSVTRDAVRGGVRQGLREVVKSGAKSTLQEIPEEIITELGHNVASAVSGVDPNATTPEALQQTVADTVVQTIITGGMIHGPQAAAAGTRGLARQQRLAELKALRAKGPVSRKGARDLGLGGESQQDRTSAADAEIQQLEQEIQDASQIQQDEASAQVQGDAGQGGQEPSGGEVRRRREIEGGPEQAGQVAPAPEVQVEPEAAPAQDEISAAVAEEMRRRRQSQQPPSPTPPVETLADAGGAMGGAIADNFYDAILQSLEKTGEVPPQERKSTVGRAWDRARGILSPEEFVDQLRTGTFDADRLRGEKRKGRKPVIRTDSATEEVPEEDIGLELVEDYPDLAQKPSGSPQEAVSQPDAPEAAQPAPQQEAARGPEQPKEEQATAAATQAVERYLQQVAKHGEAYVPPNINWSTREGIKRGLREAGLEPHPDKLNYWRKATPTPKPTPEAPQPTPPQQEASQGREKPPKRKGRKETAGELKGRVGDAYRAAKQSNPEALALIKVGDFYELFHDDAKAAAKALGLTLTTRDKGSKNPVPMAGFPYHQLEGYLGKLIAAGHRAAVVEMVEDAKGREVERVVSPETLTEPVPETQPKPQKRRGRKDQAAEARPAGEQLGLLGMEEETADANAREKALQEWRKTPIYQRLLEISDPPNRDVEDRRFGDPEFSDSNVNVFNSIKAEVEGRIAGSEDLREWDDIAEDARTQLGTLPAYVDEGTYDELVREYVDNLVANLTDGIKEVKNESGAFAIGDAVVDDATGEDGVIEKFAYNADGKAIAFLKSQRGRFQDEILVEDLRKQEPADAEATTEVKTSKPTDETPEISPAEERPPATADADIEAAMAAAVAKRFGKKPQAEPRPQPQQKPKGQAKPKPKSKAKQATEARAEQTKAKLDEVFSRFKKVMGDDTKATTGLDPEKVSVTVELMAAAVDHGISKFADFVVFVSEGMGANVTKDIAKYLEFGWKSLGRQEGYSHIDSAGKVSAVLEERHGSRQDAGTRPSQEPDVQLAQNVAIALRDNDTIDSPKLHGMAEKAYGGTRAQGAYDPSRANDAMELGVNLYVSQAKPPAYHPPTADFSEAAATIHALDNLVRERLPPHTTRSGLKDTAQQFSTPPAYAYAVNWIANIAPGDTVLEPSAGTGGLAVHAIRAGAKVYVNELKEVGWKPNRRAQLLREIGAENVFTEDAEQIGNILSGKVQPTVVVMNPPFSTAAGRMTGKKIVGTDLKHIDAALQLLAPEGRLVAIIGAGLHGKSQSLQKWEDGLRGQGYNLRADIELGRDVYKGYGTTFPTRVLVIDKAKYKPFTVDVIESEGAVGTGKAPKTLHGKAESLYDLIDQLKEIRDERIPAPQHESTRTESERTPAEREPRPRPEPSVRPPTRPVVPGGEKTGDTGTTGEKARPSPRRPGEPVERPTREGGPETVPEPGLPEAGRPGTGGESTAEPGKRGTTRTEVGGEPVRKPVKPDSRPEPPAQPDVRPKRRKNELTESVYESYEPRRVSIKGAKPHPASVVESSAMAAIDPPSVEYAPDLPEKTVTTGALSDIQLEAIAYAGHAHGQEIEIEGKAYRKGFLIGDGTGIGKGRTAAGIILDNFRQGRTKAVWVSKNYGLLTDSKEYSDAVGLPSEKLFSHQKTASGVDFEAKDGVLFTTYETMRGTPSAKAMAEGKQKSRLDQVVDWLGEGFDGVIVFDEAHLMGNAVDSTGGRGLKKASARALSGLDLQRRLPQARVVYMSATAATEVSNLAYAERLGLWGKGTAFANQAEFTTEITKGGVAAMEKVAGDMKAMGLYVSRNISFNDGTEKGTVEYERMEHTLTPDEEATYNKMAEAWGIVFQNMNDALDLTDGKKNGRAVSAARSAFWGANQRFWNQIITAMQTPTVIRAIEEDLKAGRSAVIQLTNTNEAATQRALADLDEESGYEEIDTSPRGILMDFVEKSFPVWQHEEYTDENGNVRTRPVVDTEGNKVKNANAVRLQEQLLDELGSLQAGSRGAIDMVLDHFGSQNVAEITGRTMRLVKNKDGKLEKESRGKAKTTADIKAFQNGKKSILIFSEAGGTGASYHADLNRKNQQQRKHYLLQAGWRADVAIQGLGRTHRSNQAQAPVYSLVHTNLKGQKRFISTIARRLSQLGAITKGQRQAVAGGEKAMFTAADNLESTEARQALLRFYEDVRARAIESITLDDLETRMGLKLTDENGNLRNDLPPITQFLNRVLSLPVSEQNAVFDAFEQRLQEQVEMAQARGELDQGIETVRADRIAKTEERSVYQHESGAETKYVKVAVSRKTKPTLFSELPNNVELYVRSKKTGTIMAAVPTGTSEVDTRSGQMLAKAKVYSPMGRTYGYIEKMRNAEYYDFLDQSEARTAWSDAVATIPEFHVTDEHFLTGVLLPIWNRIPGENTRVMRMLTDEGEMILGRQIPEDQVSQTLRALGVSVDSPKLSPAHAAEEVLGGNKELLLANGWRVRRSLVGGENRMELIGPSFVHHGELGASGVFWERIQNKTRYFIPVDKAADVLADVLEGRPIMDVIGKKRSEQAADRKEDAKERFLEAGRRLIDPTKPSAGLDPAKVKDAVDMAIAAIDYGVASFDEFVSLAVESFTEQWVRDRAGYLEEAARQAGIEGVTPIADVLDKPPEPPKGKGPPPLPRKRPEASDDPVTSIKNEIVNELRERRGLPEIPGVEAQSQQEWLDRAEAILADDPGRGDRIVKEINKNPRNLSNTEVAVMQIHYRRLNNQLEESSERLFDAHDRGDSVEAAIAQADVDNAMTALAEMEDATKAAGREWGRAGVARQITLARDFSLAGMMRRARVANAGAPLSAEQQAEIAAMAKTIEELEGKLSRLEQEKSDRERERRVDEGIAEDKKKAKRTGRKTAARKKVDAAWAEFESLAKGKLYSTPIELAVPAAKIVSAYVELGVVSFAEFMANVSQRIGADATIKAHDVFRAAWDDAKAKGGIPTPEVDLADLAGITRLARRIQRALVESGITKRDDVVDAVHESLQEVMPGFTRRETMDALSGYGQFTPLSKDEIDRTIRDINGQLQQLAKLEDMEAGKAPAKTGPERRTPSDEERRLIQQVNEAKKRGGFNVTDPEQQLKTALDAAKTATRNRIADLEHEIRTKERIVRERRELTPDAELEALRKQRDELRKVHEELFPPPQKKLTDAQRIANAVKAADRAIKLLEQQLATRNFDRKRPPPLSSPELNAKRARLAQLRAAREAAKALEESQWEGEGGALTGKKPLSAEEISRRAYEASLRKRIADYQQRIANREFDPRPKKEPRKLDPQELKLKKQLEDVKHEFFEKAAEYRLANMSPGERAWDYAKETAHLSRAAMTSIDLSAVFRQGGPAVFAHPVLAAKAGKEMLKALASRQAEFNSMEEIRNRPNGQLYETARLSITEDEGKLTRQEEAYMGRWSKKVPGIAASARAYTTFLNNIRADLFDAMVENLGRGGQVTLDEAKVIARYVNVATGRADLGKYNQAAANLNMVFFAPRYVASRFQYLAMPFYLPFTKTSGRVKKLIAAEYARHAAGVTTFLGLAVALASLLTDDDDEKPTVEIDPRSSDFLKLRIGETRIDPMSGLSQVVVVSARVLGGKTKTAGGEVKPIRGPDVPYGQQTTPGVLGNFLRTKLAPVPGAAVDVLAGETVVGEPVTPASATAKMFIPLSLREVKDTMQARGIPAGTAISILGLLGMGLGTYGPKTRYMTGSPEERIEQFDADLKNMQWDSPDPAYSEFLSDEQLEQVRQRREDRKQSVVTAAVVDAQTEKSEEELEKAKEKLRDTGWSHLEAQQHLLSHYKGDKSSNDYWTKFNALAELYGLDKDAARDELLGPTVGGIRTGDTDFKRWESEQRSRWLEERKKKKK